MRVQPVLADENQYYPRTNPSAGFSRSHLSKRKSWRPDIMSNALTISCKRHLRMRSGRDADTKSMSRHQHDTTRLQVPTTDESSELPLAMFLLRRHPLSWIPAKLRMGSQGIFSRRLMPLRRRLTSCAFPLCASSISLLCALQTTFFTITPGRYILCALFFTAFLHDSLLRFTFKSTLFSKLHKLLLVQEHLQEVHCLRIHRTRKQYAGVRWCLHVPCFRAIPS